MKEEIKYPCIMQSASSEVIVLFHEKDQGIVLNNVGTYTIGFKAGIWDMSMFIPYTLETKPSEYPKVMLVGDLPQIKRAVKRVVFMEKDGAFLAWTRAETLEEAKTILDCTAWAYAWDIPVEQQIKEVTIEEVANKFGVSNIKIVKSHSDV